MWVRAFHAHRTCGSGARTPRVPQRDSQVSYDFDIVEKLAGLSNFAVGAIVIGVLLAAALLAGRSGPSSKEVNEEARKKLVGKLADDKANAQHAALKGAGAGVQKLLLVAVIAGVVAWLVVKNQDPDQKKLTPVIATTTTTVPGGQ